MFKRTLQKVESDFRMRELQTYFKNICYTILIFFVSQIGFIETCYYEYLKLPKIFKCFSKTKIGSFIEFCCNYRTHKIIRI